jgi:hypothetical protein
MNQHPLITAILKKRVERLLQGKPTDELQLNSEDVLILKKFSEPYMLYFSSTLTGDFIFSGIQIIENSGVPPFLNRPD